MFRQITRHKVAIVVAIAILCSIAFNTSKAEATSFGKISQIYAFGDSYSDNGKLLRITTDAIEAGVLDAVVLPADPALGLYDREGRWTNGLTAVEVLAQNIKTNLTDYAVGGGKTGNGNVNIWLDAYQNTGVFGQVEQYKAGLKGQTADPNALYFVFVSTNDFFEYAFGDTTLSVEERSAQAVNNVAKSISELATLGAKQFLVVNSTDLALLPVLSTQVKEADRFTNSFNTILPGKLETLSNSSGTEIALYDHVAISNKIRSNPVEYGLVNLNKACQPVFPEVKPVCSKPDEYYFWDEFHPTRRIYQFIGEDMAKFVQSHQPQGKKVFEPSMAAGLLFTLGCIVSNKA